MLVNHGTWITIWSDVNIQLQLDGARRKKTVFEKVASKMAELGYERDW